MFGATSRSIHRTKVFSRTTSSSQSLAQVLARSTNSLSAKKTKSMLTTNTILGKPYYDGKKRTNEEEFNHPPEIEDKERRKKILLVGDGDFSMSLAIARTRPMNDVYATSLSTKDEIFENWKGKENVQALESLKNVKKVEHGVDATKAEDLIRTIGIENGVDFVCFAFPHLPGKGKIGKNRELLRGFFRASKEVLKKDGFCEVALAPGQGGTFVDGDESRKMYGDTWQAYDCGAEVGMALVHCERFNEEKWREIGYKPTGHWRGLDDSRSFRVSNAVVHAYKREEEVDEENDGPVSQYQRESHKRDVSLAVLASLVKDSLSINSSNEGEEKIEEEEEEEEVLKERKDMCVFVQDQTCSFALRCVREQKLVAYTRLTKRVPNNHPKYSNMLCCGKCFMKIVKNDKYKNDDDDNNNNNNNNTVIIRNSPSEVELLEKIVTLASVTASEMTWKKIEIKDAKIIDRYDPKDKSDMVARNVRLSYFCNLHPLTGREVNDIQHNFREKIERGEIEGVSLRWYRNKSETTLTKKQRL